MVATSRCLGSLALLLAGAEGARVDRHKNSRSKFVAGVPLLNYHLAFEGHETLAKTENQKQDWTVFVNPGVSDEQLASLCKATDCKAVGHPSRGGVPFMAVSCTEAELEKTMQQAKDVVKYVEPDSQVDAIPEIEAAPEAATWGLNRIAADLRDRVGGGTTIFVLDTGVRTTHDDFTGRASPGGDASSGSLVECNGNLNCAADSQGHGTHCAGTAGGSTYGVATAAQISAVKVLDDQGRGQWEWSYAALDWLATSSVRPAVASMSLGGTGVVQGMKDAVDAAVASGVTVSVAAGNNNRDACGYSPAYVPSAITVGSTDSLDARSYFSNYGLCVDIWAPGSSVLSLSHESDTGTATLSGTSMACPHVSGAAALVLGADPSKNSAKVLQELMEKAAKDEISDLQPGDTNAMLWVGEGSAPTPVPTPAPPPGTWSVTGSGCTMIGNCIQSNNHPGEYGVNEECTIQAYIVDFTNEAFETERDYDFMTVTPSSGLNIRRYSGQGAGTGPPNENNFTGTISWSSDQSVTLSGWKLCKA